MARQHPSYCQHGRMIDAGFVVGLEIEHCDECIVVRENMIGEAARIITDASEGTPRERAEKVVAILNGLSPTGDSHRE